MDARLTRTCNRPSAVSLRKGALKSGRHLYWKGKYSAVINLNILMWISRTRVRRIRRIDNATYCQQVCGLSYEITHAFMINMFGDVSVFGSGLWICQAAVSSSIHLTFIFHSRLFISYSFNPSLIHVITIVEISVVYVKCTRNFHQIVGTVYLHGFFVVGTRHSIDRILNNVQKVPFV